MRVLGGLSKLQEGVQELSGCILSVARVQGSLATKFLPHAVVMQRLFKIKGKLESS